LKQEYVIDGLSRKEIKKEDILSLQQKRGPVSKAILKKRTYLRERGRLVTVPE
jgi:hypothetical protein